MSTAQDMFHVKHAGVDSLIALLPQTDEHTPARLAIAADHLRRALGQALIETVPGPASLFVQFNLRLCDEEQAHTALKQALHTAWDTGHHSDSGREHHIPVYHAPEAGADLWRLAQHTGLMLDEIIAAHCAPVYRVTAVGFAPGFAYLSGLDPRLNLPRLDTPRARVPAGSVAIAAGQCAIYPRASPGGWNLIGLTPTPPGHPAHPDSGPTLAVGDRVRFSPIDRRDFLSQGGVLPP